MPRTIISQSKTMTLEEVTLRLSRREAVDGIVIIGSASTNELTPDSDYDLVVVLSDMPAPLHVGLTYIDQRLTDILFVTVSEVEQILSSDEPMDADTRAGRTVRWLQAGRIAFDRSGRLQRARRKVQIGIWLKPVNESEIYPAWFGVNYNLKQNRRMLATPLKNLLSAPRTAAGAFYQCSHCINIATQPRV